MEHENDLYWHALNYRTAGIYEAEFMWQELQACVNRLIVAERERAMKAVLDGCPSDGSDAELILRRAWDRIRTMKEE